MILSDDGFKEITKPYVEKSVLDIALLYYESNIYSLVPVGFTHGTWLFIPVTHVLAVTATVLCLQDQTQWRVINLCLHIYV